MVKAYMARAMGHGKITMSIWMEVIVNTEFIVFYSNKSPEFAGLLIIDMALHSLYFLVHRISQPPAFLFQYANLKLADRNRRHWEDCPLQVLPYGYRQEYYLA